eukprot:495650-Rhodomonas_salina.2
MERRRGTEAPGTCGRGVSVPAMARRAVWKRGVRKPPGRTDPAGSGGGPLRCAGGPSSLLSLWLSGARCQLGSRKIAGHATEKGHSWFRKQTTP